MDNTHTQTIDVDEQNGMGARQVVGEIIGPDGNFPNNGALPVLLYGAAPGKDTDISAEMLEQLLAKHGWGGSWRNGVYPYHHYHSRAHEFLGCYCGWAEVQLGGPNGPTHRITAGDALVLPAGISHKRLRSGDGFAVVGAYPDGQSPDMRYGKPEERDEAEKEIHNVPLPSADPLYGGNGPLAALWKNTGIQPK